MRRQRALAVGAEQALGAKLFLERLESQAQRTIASRLHRIEDQLIVATAFEQGHLAAHPYRQAITQCLAHPRGALPEEGAAHLGTAVLEGEVHVTGGRPGQVGNLALHPHAAENVFQQHPGAAIELADGEHITVKAEAFERVFDHGKAL